MAASNPARLSVQAMKISSTPRFRRPLSTVAQNLALSFSPTHMPSTSFWPSSLSPLIDCFDGLVVNWTVGHSPNAALVNTMLDQAIAALTEGQHPIIHTDRGCHYRWPGWIERMERTGLTRSMSQKGCSPDNSACEGFLGCLINEIFYGRSWYGVSLDDFIQELNAYIHWYNHKRIKLSLGGLSPLEYRHKIGPFRETCPTFLSASPSNIIFSHTDT